MWRLLRLGFLLQAMLAFFAGLAPSPASAGDPYADKRTKIAIVIGMSAYQHAKPLPNTLGDANLISKKIEEAGFTVETILDAPLAGLTATLQSAIDKTKGADIALVYYAGHTGHFQWALWP